MTDHPGRLLPILLGLVLLLGACGDAGDADGTIRVYTSVTQDTVDAVVAGFEAANPDATVEVFRAPTGELTARIAAELRDGDLGADVLWLTDPLSIQQYAADGLLAEWEPAEVDAVPPEFRTGSFFGTRILNMVIVAGTGVVPPPADWADLAENVPGGVAIPDPGFAGSAFGALAYFALTDGFGMPYYEALAGGGAVQVRSPGEVVTGVAEGQYGAGMTLDRSARAAVADGSPLTLVWPESGAIAIYSPIAVVEGGDTGLGKAFVDHVLGAEAQAAIAATGWQPIRADVEWPHGGEQVSLDWAEAFDRQEELLASYREIFGG